MEWANGEGGYDRLPDGIFDLMNALHGDLHEMKEAEQKSGRRRAWPATRSGKIGAVSDEWCGFD